MNADDLSLAIPEPDSATPARRGARGATAGGGEATEAALDCLYAVQGSTLGAPDSLEGLR